MLQNFCIAGLGTSQSNAVNTAITVSAGLGTLHMLCYKLL